MNCAMTSHSQNHNYTQPPTTTKMGPATTMQPAAGAPTEAVAAAAMQPAEVLMKLKSSIVGSQQAPSAMLVSPLPPAHPSLTVVVSNTNSPSCSNNTSPVLAPIFTAAAAAAAFVAVTNSDDSQRLLAPSIESINNNENMFVDQYANIIRAQALVRSMYELERIRASNELVNAVILANRSNQSGSKPTVVKATSAVFSSYRSKIIPFRHYGTSKNQQRIALTTMPNLLPKINSSHHKCRLRQSTPLSPPPMLWKPTMVAANKNRINVTSDGQEKAAKSSNVKSVSPVTVVATPTTITASM